MDGNAPAFEPQRLAQQLAFVRRLARGLARGADEADELAAKTVAAAWVQRPETGAAFGGWLRRVAQRLRRREREADERRAARERAVARPEATPPTDELAAQLELTRRITAALEALDEPFRRTLFDRYFLDRTPSEIAETSSVPLATVKSRLQRGLEQLRRRLDVAHGGRRDGWMAAIVPWIGGPAIVATKAKVLPLAAAALLLASGSVALWRPWERGGNETARMPETAVAVDVRDDGHEATGDGADAAATRAVRETMPLAPEALPFAAGVVVDEGGAPLAGVRVVQSQLSPTGESDPAFAMPFLDFERIDVRRTARTDAMGRFAVVEADERLGALHFLKDGFALVDLHDLAADVRDRQELRVVLPRQRTVEGVVRDSEGRPIWRARMGVGPVIESGEPFVTRVARHLPDAPSYTTPATFVNFGFRADDEGRFAFLSLPAARFTLHAHAPGYLALGELDEKIGASWDPRLVRSDVFFDLTDADSGAPIEKAVLLLLDAKTGELLRRGVTYSNFAYGGEIPPGRFLQQLGIGDRFAYLPSWLDERQGGGPRTVVMHVIALGYATAIVRLDLDAKREPPHLALALDRDDEGARPIGIGGTVNRPARLGLHLLHPDDSPEGVDGRPALIDIPSTPDGRFAFRDLPRARWVLVAHADGCAPWSRVVESPDEHVAVELEEDATLEVAVVDGAGIPVASAIVLLQLRDGDVRRAWRGKSNDEGLVRFEGLPARRFDVAAFDVAADEAQRDDSVVLRPSRGVVWWPYDDSCFFDPAGATLAAGSMLRFETTLVDPVAVELRLVTSDGRPATEARFVDGTVLEGPHFSLLDDEAARRRLTPAVDGDGVARLELWPGRYSFGIARGGAMTRAEVAVPRARSSATIVTIDAPLPTGVWRGRLVERGSGHPIAFRDVELDVTPDGSQWVDCGGTTTDRDGRFEFSSAPVGEGHLSIHADERAAGGRGGMPDLESPWPAAHLEITIAATRPGAPVDEVVIELPAIRGADGSIATLPFRVEVVDAESRAPLPETMVKVDALLDDLVIDLVKWKTDEHGRAEGRLWDATRYRVYAGGDKRYRTAVVEIAPQDGAVVATIALTRKP